MQQTHGTEAAAGKSPQATEYIEMYPHSPRISSCIWAHNNSGLSSIQQHHPAGKLLYMQFTVVFNNTGVIVLDSTPRSRDQRAAAGEGTMMQVHPSRSHGRGGQRTPCLRQTSSGVAGECRGRCRTYPASEYKVPGALEHHHFNPAAHLLAPSSPWPCSPPPSPPCDPRSCLAHGWWGE